MDGGEGGVGAKEEWERGGVGAERGGGGGGLTGLRAMVWAPLATILGAELWASYVLCSTGKSRFRPSHPLVVDGLSDAEVRTERMALSFLV